MDELVPVTTWLDKYYPFAHNFILECTQEAGDVVFVPHGYSHAVVNTKDSIGLANQVREGESQRGANRPGGLNPLVAKDHA